MGDKVEVVFNIPYFDIPITNVVIMSWIIMAVIILWAFISTRKKNLVPKGLQNVAEALVEFLNNFIGNFVEDKKDVKKILPYIGTVFLFLAVCNTIGALFMTELTEGTICPPTRILAVPAGVAITTILYAIISGIQKKGIKGFIKRLFEPTPVMFPMNLLDFMIKPLSLALRLFGNICGAFLIMEIIMESVAWVVPVFASMYLDLFDGLLQMYVFTLLSTVYIAEEVHIESEEHAKEKEEIRNKEKQLLEMEVR